MKTYTHYKRSLLAALLSLHTLSGCLQTHTRQEIDFTKSIPRFWHRCNLTGKTLLVVVPVGVTVLAASSACGVYYAMNRPNGGNSTDLTTTIFPPTDFTTTPIPPTEAPIITTKPPVTSTTEAPVPSTTKAPVPSTTEAPLIVKDPDVIDDTILAYLKKNNFSLESIERVWGPDLGKNANGQDVDENVKRPYLHINAKDKNGCNILNLIALAEKPDERVIKLLNEAGIDSTVKCELSLFR